MSEETPLDRFKRALTGGARAIAREPEVEVAWSADRPGAAGKNFRVPLPGRQLPPEQAAEARGFADSFALKIRLHDNALHDSGAPGDPVARAVYDAVEQVRYEALGARGFAGVGENLAAATELRAASDPIARATEARDVPLSTAVSLMMREALTGRPIPSRAQKGVDLVRKFVEERTGGDFSALADKLDESCMQKTPLQFVGPASLRWGGPGGKQLFFNGTDVTEGVQPPGSVWRMNPIPRNDPWGTGEGFEPVCDWPHNSGTGADQAEPYPCQGGPETGLGNLEM